MRVEFRGDATGPGRRRRESPEPQGLSPHSQITATRNPVVTLKSVSCLALLCFLRVCVGGGGLGRVLHRFDELNARLKREQQG